MTTHILIPSRLSSTRVPQKALAMVGGVPMIRRVALQCIKTGLPVTVCTDSEAIRDVVADIVPVLLSPSEVPNGTERIALAAKDLSLNSKILDVQGDDPFVDPESILDLARRLDSIHFGCIVPHVQSSSPVEDAEKVSVVKLILNDPASGKVLYMTRRQTYHADYPVLKHASIIGFVNHTLQMFATLPQAQTEIVDRIELMRLLQSPVYNPVYTYPLVGVPGISVDTPDDLVRANDIASTAISQA